MEFGKVDHPQNVDFTLVPDPPENTAVFTANQVKTNWSVGLTGWADSGWRGDLYPHGAKASDYLSHYSRSFNCIELNPSFYHPLAPAMIQKWVSKVPEDFRFCPKLWQGLSHEKVPDSRAVIGEIQRVHQGFGENLGPAFLQLPPKVGSDHLEWLMSLLEPWSSEQELFLEVRNPELASNQDLHQYLVRRRIGLVITDVAGFRDLVHMRLTIPRLFLRFVATGLASLDRQRIVDWMFRLDQWHVAGLEEATIFLHHSDNLFAPDLARRWLEVSNEVGASFFSMKTPLHYRGNTQRELFD